MGRLTQSRLWTKANAKERAALDALLDAHAGSRLACKCIEKLAEMCPAFNRKHPLLARGLDGRSTAELFVAAQFSDEIAEHVLEALLLPTDVTQGDLGACAAASLEVSLRRIAPAEYVRCLGALARGGVYEPVNGVEVGVPPDVLADAADPRPWPSRVFQSAAMQFGQTGVYSHTKTAREGGRNYYSLSLLELIPKPWRFWIVLLLMPIAPLLASIRIRRYEGQSLSHIIRLLSAMTAESYTLHKFDDAALAQRFFRSVAARVDFDPARIHVTVPARREGEALHAMSFLEYDVREAHSIRLLNTWRSAARGQIDDRLHGLRRAEVDGADVWSFDLRKLDTAHPLYIGAPRAWSS